MDPAALFVIQFFWFLTAWAVLAALFVRPRLRGRAGAEAVALCTSPQIFRVLGVGLLAPNLAPGLPRSFALSTAAGDSVTAVLALLAVIALCKRWPSGAKLGWACNVVGICDLALALPHAALVGASRFLTGQWYVPALVVPLMIVSHVMAVLFLLEQRSARTAP
jgi:hypothetical protein